MEKDFYVKSRSAKFISAIIMVIDKQKEIEYVGNSTLQCINEAGIRA